METLVKIIHVMVCIFLMLTVLLQAGKGGGMGAAFGGGTSMGTVFGGSGAGNFLKKLTVAAAMIFMITSMTLAWMATPSTDPLKEYWAQQQAAALERERAHKAAIEDAEKNKKPEGEDLEGIDKPEEDVSPEGDPEDAVDTPEGSEAQPEVKPEAKPEGAEAEAKPAPAPDAIKPPRPKKVNPAQPVLPTPTPEGEPKPEPIPSTTP